MRITRYQTIELGDNLHYSLISYRAYIYCVMVSNPNIEFGFPHCSYFPRYLVAFQTTQYVLGL